MDRRSYRYAIRAAVVAIAVGFIICASAAERAEQASSVEVEAALARGHASLEANQYSTAEAAYAEALQLAEQHRRTGGRARAHCADGAGKGAR